MAFDLGTFLSGLGGSLAGRAGTGAAPAPAGGLAAAPVAAPIEEELKIPESVDEARGLYFKELSNLRRQQQALLASLEARAATGPQEMLRNISAAMLDPGRTGNFGEAFGRMQTGLSRQAAEEGSRAEQIAKMRLELNQQNVGMAEKGIALAQEQQRIRALQGMRNPAQGVASVPANTQAMQVAASNAGLNLPNEAWALIDGMDSKTAIETLTKFVLKNNETPDAIKSIRAFISMLPPEQQAGAGAARAKVELFGKPEDRATAAEKLIRLRDDRIITKEQFDEEMARLDPLKPQPTSVPARTNAAPAATPVAPFVAAPAMAPSASSTPSIATFSDPSIRVISGTRTNQQQQVLWDQSVAAGTPGRMPNGNPVARPGTSAHEAGQAIDVDSRSLTQSGRRELAQKGYFQPLPNDPNHWELISMATTRPPAVAMAAAPAATPVAAQRATTAEEQPSRAERETMAAVEKERQIARDAEFKEQRVQINGWESTSINRAKSDLAELARIADQYPKAFNLLGGTGFWTALGKAADEGIKAGTLGTISFPVETFVGGLKLSGDEKIAIRRAGEITARQFFQNARESKSVLGPSISNADAVIMKEPLAKVSDPAKYVAYWAKENFLLNQQREELHKAYRDFEKNNRAAPLSAFFDSPQYSSIAQKYDSLSEQLRANHKPYRR